MNLSELRDPQTDAERTVDPKVERCLRPVHHTQGWG